MKKFLFIIVSLIATANFSQDKPKLVVGIVVDQMKMEYLYRFSNDFSENGFKRLMNQGYTFHNTHYNYMPTYTAPGHASVYTGTTPAVHGIVGNEWFNKATGKEMYCTDDETVSTIGDDSDKEVTKTDEINSYLCKNQLGTPVKISFITRIDQGNKPQLYVYFKDFVFCYDIVEEVTK